MNSDYEGFLNRLSDDGHQTKGQLVLKRAGQMVFTCLTLELPWKDNDPVTSCYPPGKYLVLKRYSAAHGWHWHVQVPGRALRLIHIGNYAASKNPKTRVADTKGCTLVGAQFADLNGDHFADLTGSTATMAALNAHLEGVTEFFLHVSAPK